MLRIPIDDPRWSAFVASHEDAGPFHHPAWARLLADCYEFSAFVLVELDEAGAVTQGLPMVQVGGRLRSRGWVSLPYTDFVPALLSQSGGGDVFLDRVDQGWRDAGVDYLQVRASLPGREASQHETDVIHALELDNDPETVARRFHKMAARGIRKAERDGVVVRRGERREDLTEVFYRLHVATRRRQGSPVQPKRFFRLLWDEFMAKQMGHVLLAYRGTEAVAGTVFLAWNGVLIYKFSASNPAALKLRPNHLIMWRAVQEGCRDGMRLLDFGRSDSDNQGLREFKSRWGAAERPLVYTTLTKGATVHRAGHAPQLLQTVIRRSPPIVCRTAGELLYRYAA